jgi:hypothetical protein
LWNAANLHLASPEEVDNGVYDYDKSSYTCDAISKAMRRLDEEENASVDAFLYSLGFPKNGKGMCSLFYTDSDDGDCRQGVRYMWLLLAFSAAEDEGR